MLSPGTPQQVTFSAPDAAGTFPIAFQGVSGTLSHSASTTLTVTPQPSPYLVSASYYPWYIAGSWDNQTLRGDLIPSELPALGQYLSQDEDVVTQQIAWSTAAGINVWDLEWIVPNDFEDQTIQNTIMTNPHIGDIRFAIFYDYAQRFNLDFNLTPDKVTTILSDFQYIAAHFFSHPSYLKLGQGRPVVFFYASLQLTPISAIQPMVSSIRQEMSAAGFDVYLIGDEYYAGFLPPDPTRIGNWDGIFGYDTYTQQGGYSDDNGFFALHSNAYAQYQAVAQQLGVDFIPSLTPGYNDRVVRPAANNPALARRTSATAPEGSMFMNFLANLALPYANNSRFKMIHITSFNEWHEDTELEPTVITVPTTTDTSSTGSQYTQGLVYQGYGTDYLDILRNEISTTSH
jgi:glycoprotein endo-alpha-1,2-mannosidase